MKKNYPLKILFIIFLSLTTIFLVAFSAFLILTSNVKIDENKLIKVEGGFEYYDSAGSLMAEAVEGNSITSSEKIPDHVKKAFVAIEDKRFYRHHGVDFKALIRATANNIKSRSLKEGGSTITQQLIKNTHLSGEKTFKRKLLEMRLAIELEKRYDKDEIIEKYLNTIYFGSGAYGIANASRTYFDKRPEDLTINEAAVLAAIIKAPSVYSPVNNNDKCECRKNLVLDEMFAQGYINENEYDESKNNFPRITVNDAPDNRYDYLYLAEKEASSLFDTETYYGGRKKIYTAFEKDKQKTLESTLKSDNTQCEKSAVLINRKGKIIAYYSTAPEQKRQAGSTLKPLVAYAPAIETGSIAEMTPILDEKTDFNGYSPANYNNKYYGYVSVKESLAKSLNACAVKILNYVGIERAKSYLAETGINLSENDNSLCLALGCTEKGVFLKDLVGAYTIFLRGGLYKRPSVFSERNTLHNKQFDYGKKIFSCGTCDVMNDMLSFTVENGTAKKLSFLDIPIYAKTGTVGNKTGNTDAYCISFTSEYALGVWYGNFKGSLMKNSVTGGTLPTESSSKIWQNIYKERKPTAIEKSDESVLVKLDKISYDKDKTLVVADDNSPERYIMEGLFTSNNKPLVKSNRFSLPKIECGELSVNNGEITIRLCLTQLYEAAIYRTESGHRELIFTIKGSADEIVLSDKRIMAGKLYEYSVIPYYKNESNCFYGKEIVLGKIKAPQSCGADEWWKDDFE